MSKKDMKKLYITARYRNVEKEVSFPVPAEFVQLMNENTDEGLIEVTANNKAMKVSIRICDFGNNY